MTAAASDTTAAPARHDLPGLPERPIDTDEYQDLYDRDVIAPGPYELLRGWVVAKSPTGPEHDTVVGALMLKLFTLLPQGWHVRSGSPASLGSSEPEPDIHVAMGASRDYDGRHPRSGETALVVEVADSSLERDRTVKLGICAEALVPVYWVVNLVDRCVEVNSDPIGSEDEDDGDDEDESGDESVDDADDLVDEFDEDDADDKDAAAAFGYRKRQVFRFDEPVPVVIDGEQTGRIDMSRLLNPPPPETEPEQAHEPEPGEQEEP